MSQWMLIIWVVVFIAIFYFMAIRPQQRQRRAHMELLNSLKRGDTIITAAGIYGKVNKVDDQMVEVEISKGVVVKIHRRSVSEIVRDKDLAKSVTPGRGTRAKNPPAELEEPADESYDAPVEGSADETYADGSDQSGEGEDSQKS